jgi:hypothetical protein
MRDKKLPGLPEIGLKKFALFFSGIFLDAALSKQLCSEFSNDFFILAESDIFVTPNYLFYLAKGWKILSR